MAHALNDDERRLYELIWKRTIASQMASAEMERTTITIENTTDNRPDTELRATGSVVRFDGFLTLYQEGRDDGEDEAEKRLPLLDEGTEVQVSNVVSDQHFTEPPPRFSEASLVKKMEELGIGRPSTYASILSVLKERTYVHMEKNRFIPDDKGRLVTIFLEKFFTRYVEYDFTANLEGQLDTISDGGIDWKQVLRDFWNDFKPKTDEVLGVRNAVVIDALDDYLAPILFPESDDGTDPRKCPKCDDGRLGLKTSRYGAFIGCSNYPECGYTKPFSTNANADDDAAQSEDRDLGTDPVSGLTVSFKTGRFGPYIQLGETIPKGEKPKRASIPRDIKPEDVTFDIALKLINLPRVVGVHPESGEEITAAIGRYGPYLAHAKKYTKLENSEDAFTIGLNRAVTVIAENKDKQSTNKAMIKDLGEHPDGGALRVMDGRYGPYVNHKRVNATLPKDLDPLDVTFDQAVALIAERAAKVGAKKAPAKKAAAKKTATKKAPAKKATTKKAAAKKTTTRKTATKKTTAKKADA